MADDTYSGAGNYNIVFKGKSITVKSVNGSGNCIIDCGLNDLNRRAFLLNMEEIVTLEGLTIQNGNYLVGGAIFASTGTNLTIKDCVFENNRATRGSGGAVHSKVSTFTN